MGRRVESNHSASLARTMDRNCSRPCSAYLGRDLAGGALGAEAEGGHHLARGSTYAQAAGPCEEHRGGGLRQGRGWQIDHRRQSGARLGGAGRPGGPVGCRHLRAQPAADDGAGRRQARRRPTASTSPRLRAHGVEVMSIGFLIDAEQPMVWRGPMVTQALTQLLGETSWGRTRLPGGRHAARYRRHPADAGAARPGERRHHRHHAAGHRAPGRPQGPEDVREGRSAGARRGGEHEHPHLQPVRPCRAHLRQRRRCAHGGAIRRAVAGRAAARYPDSRGGRRRVADGGRRPRQRPRARLPADGAARGGAPGDLEQGLQLARSPRSPSRPR